MTSPGIPCACQRDCFCADSSAYRFRQSRRWRFCDGPQEDGFDQYGVETYGEHDKAGGVSFYMKAVEHIPFLPENDGAYIRAKPFQSVVGAFVDTRALSGVITFGLFLNRIGSVFGDESFGRRLPGLRGESRSCLPRFISESPG